MERTRDLVSVPEGMVEKAHELQLVNRARSGEREALRALVDLHKDRLFAFIWRIIRNHHDAEEICQDAFLKAFASLDSFRSEFRFSTWLFTIGYRVCLNRMRRKRDVTTDLERASLPPVSDDVASSKLESEEAVRLKETVWAAVDRLTMPQRAAVLLFYRHELDCREIARILEVPVATVKSHLHRARNRLRDMLESLSDQDLKQFRNLSGRAG